MMTSLLCGASAGTAVGNKSVSAPQLHCNACSQTLILLKCPTFKADDNVYNVLLLAGADEFGAAD